MKLAWIFFGAIVLIIILSVTVLGDLIQYVMNYGLSHLKNQKVVVSKTKCTIAAVFFGWNVGLLGGLVVWIAADHWPAPTNIEPLPTTQPIEAPA